MTIQLEEAFAPTAPSATMPRFTGAYCYGMCRKGRVVFPAIFSCQVGDSIYLVQSQVPGVLVITASEQINAWARKWVGDLNDRLRYVGTLHRCDLARHTNRFLIPNLLRRYVGLNPGDDAVLSGQGSFVILARLDRWEELVRQGVGVKP